MPDNSARKNRPSWFLIVFLLVLTASIVMLLVSYFLAQISRERALYESKLVLLADLKSSEIETWRLEILSDADFIYSDSSVKQNIQTYTSSHFNPDTRIKLEQWMRYQLRKPNYSSIFLVDDTGKVLLQVDDAKEKSAGFNFLNYSTSLNSRKVELSDLYETAVGDVFMDVAIPITKDLNKTSAVTAVIILQIDPEEVLFPLVSEVPADNVSLETLMVRRDGPDVVYLNTLKYIDNIPLKMRFPVSNSELPAAKAVNSITGIVEGLDYRNIKVTVAISPIQETPWKLLAKIDNSELFENIRNQALILVIALIVTIFAAIMGFTLLWKQQSSQYYKGLYEKEVERQNLESQYSALFDQASDAILLVSENGQVLNANKQALDLYGYTKEEILNLTIKELRDVSTIPLINSDMSLVRDGKTTYFETVHIKKNGEKFLVEISSRYFQIGEKKFFQSLIRDVTNRKLVENQIKYSEMELKKAQKIAQVGSFYVNVVTDEITWSDEMYRIFNLDKNSLQEDIRKISNKFTHPDDVEWVNKLVESSIKKKKNFSFDYRIILPNGQNRELHTEIGEFSLAQDGSTIGYSGTIQDITESKAIERELRRRENQLSKILEILPVGLEILDKSGNVIQINKAMNQIWNTESDNSETNGKSGAVFVIDKTASAHKKQKSSIKSLLEGTVINGEMVEIHNETEHKTLLNYSTPIFDENNIFEGAVIVNLDITELKEAEKKLKDQLDELRRWNLATLGRENRILELKREINSLLKEKGNPIKYTSAEESRDD